jgi:hypothetical protein
VLQPLLISSAGAGPTLGRRVLVYVIGASNPVNESDYGLLRPKQLDIIVPLFILTLSDCFIVSTGSSESCPCQDSLTSAVRNVRSGLRYRWTQLGPRTRLRLLICHVSAVENLRQKHKQKKKICSDGYAPAITRLSTNRHVRAVGGCEHLQCLEDRNGVSRKHFISRRHLKTRHRRR